MMWCVEDDLYVEYATVEDFEQQREFVEGKSFLHPRLSYTTCILITYFIYLLLCINMMGPIL
jgi:hypothetical protein